jgi:DNA (cytosine-5)-methyltransferase 1
MRAVDSKRKSKSLRPVAVDLFCGAGGLSFGMKLAGVGICAGIDSDPACCHPFEANVGAKFHERDVAELSPDFADSLFPEECVRILAGCAPCQPFSTYTNKTAVRERDWQLFVKFGEMVSVQSGRWDRVVSVPT